MIETRSPISNPLPSATEMLILRIMSSLDRMAQIMERSNAAPLLLFFPVYLSVTIVIAQRKLMWDDEFFTFYISRAGGLSEILKALRTGADQHPPLFYYLTHQVMAALGTSHLTLRLPAIAGFALLCVCLFYLLRSRTSALWALLGMLLPLVSSAYYYAAEARGYSLMMGFCALALLAWQKAAFPKRHSGWLYVLFGALAGAVSSHYYAVLFVIALGIGELTRTCLLKRLDIPVWLAFCGAGAPLILFLSTIRRARGYSTHFWAIPYWSAPFDFYPSSFGAFANLVLLGALLYVFGLYRLSSAEDRDEQEPRFFVWEVMAWASIIAIPLFAVILAKTVTHGYTARYALPALIGAILVLCQFGFLITRRSRVFPLLLCLICLACFGVRAILTIKQQAKDVSELADNMVVLRPYTASSIALSDVTLFHRISFYAPRKFARHFVYVADPEASVKHLREDTIDRGLLALRPWFPLNVIPSKEYFSEQPQFLAYGSIGAWNWLTYDLVPPNYDTTLLKRFRGDALLSVRRRNPDASVPTSDARGIYSQGLFQRISADGPSLCSQWMPGDAFCATIERERIKTIARGVRETAR